MAQKMSTFLISIMVVSMCVLGFGVYYSGISTNYNVDNNQNFSGYEQITAMNDVTQQLNESVTGSYSSSLGGFNILGDFLSLGASIVKGTLNSFSYFNIMLTSGFDSIPTAGGNVGSSTIHQIELAIGGIVIIIIAFIIISVLTGRPDL